MCPSARRPLIYAPDEPQALPTEPRKLTNRLASHPNFEPDRIKALLRRLPRERVEIRAVETQQGQSGSYARGPMLDLDPVEAFESLEERPLWMLLHDTWKHDADYRTLRDEFIADLAGLFPEVGRRLSEIGCWMFLSSGRSVVHFHSDDDQSFLNNVRGGKTVYVYPASVLPERMIEEMLWQRDQGAVVYDPAYESAAYEPLHLAPGESAYLPLYAPHRVVNDDTVCVSWNVGFNTPASRRRRDTLLVNHDLRQMGVSPRPYGEVAWLDAMKARMRLPLRARNKILRALGLRSRSTKTTSS